MLVIGNGESRSNIDINLIDTVKIGCNAILREYTVDHLVCCDRRMVQEAVRANYNKHAYIYTRTDWINYFKAHDRIRTVPELPYKGDQRWDDPFHWGSGPYAVLLAAKIAHGDVIQMIGFDLYGNDRKINNVYKGTDNYAAADSKNVDPRYWIQQIGKVFSLYKSRQFKIYQKSDWQLPQAWNYPNVVVDNISNIYYNT